METTIKFSSVPEASGAYLETRCKNNSCSKHNKKLFLFIGSNLNFDYFEEYERHTCEFCDKKQLSVCNIGFLSCKWIYQGEIEDEGIVTGNMNYSLGYEVCQDVKRKIWKWLQIKVETVNTEEIDKLRKVINSSFNFDLDLASFQNAPSQSAQRFSEANQENLKKEIDTKKGIIYYLKKNLKDQQKIIKKLSKKLKCPAVGFKIE